MMTLNFVPPVWCPPRSDRQMLSDNTYLAWLNEERQLLIGAGELVRLRTDPGHCPVDARFVLKS
jgi:hypothetical protein